MEKKRMPDCKSKKKWDSENVSIYTFKAFVKTDSDIIDHLAKYPSKSGEIKRLLRIALEVEKAKEAAHD